MLDKLFARKTKTIFHKQITQLSYEVENPPWPKLFCPFKENVTIHGYPRLYFRHATCIVSYRESMPLNLGSKKNLVNECFVTPQSAVLQPLPWQPVMSCTRVTWSDTRVTRSHKVTTQSTAGSFSFITSPPINNGGTSQTAKFRKLTISSISIHPRKQ